LIEEHKYARKTVTNLVQITTAYVPDDADSTKKASELLKDLSKFYPRHIEKEDKTFFHPCKKYFAPSGKVTVSVGIYATD
jgi:hemerythrin-like domain-containing protein